MDSLERLQQEYAGCTKCPLLVANRTNVVFGVGNPKTCKVVIIGEAPGYNEDVKNEPFVGKSGQLLNEFLANIGLSRADDVYITNTILCRPPENRAPLSEELANCHARLTEQLKILAPKVIITLGNFATQYVLKTKEGITKLRGKPVEVFDFGRPTLVVPMQHPAVLLYNGNSPAKRAEFEADFQIVKTVLASKAT